MTGHDPVPLRMIHSEDNGRLDLLSLTTGSTEDGQVEVLFYRIGCEGCGGTRSSVVELPIDGEVRKLLGLFAD